MVVELLGRCDLSGREGRPSRCEVDSKSKASGRPDDSSNREKVATGDDGDDGKLRKRRSGREIRHLQNRLIAANRMNNLNTKVTRLFTKIHVRIASEMGAVHSYGVTMHSLSSQIQRHCLQSKHVLVCINLCPDERRQERLILTSVGVKTLLLEHSRLILSLHIQ